MSRLIVWHETEDHRQRLAEADERFKDIYQKLRKRDFRCTYIGSLRFDQNADPEIWLNENRPFRSKASKNLEHATQVALHHGDTGWWTLDDLDAFAEGKGPIFDTAMWELGYRRSKKDSSAWAQRKKGDDNLNPYEIYWDNRFGIKFKHLTAEETERLDRLWVMQNENAGISKTYDIVAGKNGMIYVALWANPFVGHSAETMWQLTEQTNNRGHIAKQQEGFSLEAQNILIKEQKGVYIKATYFDGSSREYVWPSVIPNEKILDLLDLTRYSGMKE